MSDTLIKIDTIELEDRLGSQEEIIDFLNKSDTIDLIFYTDFTEPYSSHGKNMYALVVSVGKSKFLISQCNMSHQDLLATSVKSNAEDLKEITDGIGINMDDFKYIVEKFNPSIHGAILETLKDISIDKARALIKLDII